MSAKKFVRLAAFCLAFISVRGEAFADKSAGPSRLRIGLALQGGGAKGFAHIGFLQWLEENRIPADIISGTSMGGLIGGFYSLGKGTDDLKDLIATLDWDELIGGQTPFRFLNIRRKEDQLAYPNQLEFGLRGGFGLPSGMNSGHGIGLILDRATLPYYSLDSFDNLPIPFRCVAVDLVTGRQIVFSQGSLRDALRSTMSIPAVFSPLRREDRAYADGGLLNNLPVDVAKNAGADFVIAVNLNMGEFDPKKTDTMAGVLDRSVDIMMAENLNRSLQMADLVVPIDVRGFTTLDFKAADAIIQKGYEAAAAMGERLKNLALPEEEWRQHLVQRQAQTRAEIPIPQFIEVEGTRPDLADAIKRNLDHFIGRPLVPDLLEMQLNDVWGWGRFASVSYTLLDREDRVGLLINLEEEERSPPTLNIGMEIDGSDVGLTRFGLGARLTLLDLWVSGSEWRTDAAFGTRNMAATEFYRPVIQGSPWFVLPRAHSDSSLFNFYRSGDRLAEYSTAHSGFGLHGGYQFNRATEIRLGQELSWYKARLRTGTAQIENYDHRVSVTSLEFRHLGQDDAVVPRRGFRLEATGEWFSSRPYEGSGFPRAKARLSFFRPVSESGSFFLGASAGTAFGRDRLGLLSFALGGIMRLGSYGRNELFGNQFYLMTAGYLHEIASLPPLIGGEIYAASWLQLGRVYGDPEMPRYPMDGSAGMIVKTLFGPILFGGSWGSEGHRKLYFRLGAIF